MSLLKVDRVSFRYGSASPILRDVSFEMQPGESGLLIGDNGSGKSTLGRLIGGLARPSFGTIAIGDQPLARVRTRERPSRTIYVSQVSYLQFFRATIAEEIALAAKQSGHPAPADDVLGHFKLPSLETNPRDLSYPEMWRLQLFLLGAVFQPSVMFVDEIVAPGAADQRAALGYTLAHRKRQGRVTLLAYQRSVDAHFDRLFRVENEMVSER
ncbi:MAG TPA: ATP-binding cassette domain-containing protein [Vicinamibacterales bacterium]|nr:ATP-binding cassette domain-containing protein [Vicinamibacterales bacterium]